MNRFSVLYQYKKQYHHLSYTTRSEAEAVLNKFSRKRKGIPIGIYDAKTELFSWEHTRQKKHSQLSFGGQAKEENAIINVVQNLRLQDEAALHDIELVELDILMRPIRPLIHSFKG